MKCVANAYRCVVISERSIQWQHQFLDMHFAIWSISSCLTVHFLSYGFWMCWKTRFRMCDFACSVGSMTFPFKYPPICMNTKCSMVINITWACVRYTKPHTMVDATRKYTISEKCSLKFYSVLCSGFSFLVSFAFFFLRALSFTCVYTTYLFVWTTINSKAIFHDCILGETKTVILASEINCHIMACNKFIQLRKFISGHVSKLDTTNHAWHRIITSTLPHIFYIHIHTSQHLRSYHYSIYTYFIYGGVHLWCNSSTPSP